jgi:hypothetical protein
MQRTRENQMYNVESQRGELKGGAFSWVVPLVFVVFMLALSWTGVFVVVSDLIETASHSLATDTARE